MKIFVTGGKGFIGKELVERLKPNGEVATFDLKDGFNLSNYEELAKQMTGFDVVVHLAAIPWPDESKTFKEYFKNNCQATLNVAEAALENKVKRIVYASSTTYYGLERGIPFIKPIKESNQTVAQAFSANELHCRPCDIAYSTSKVIAEQILANYGLNKRIEVVILRLGPTRNAGEVRPFLGVNLKMENALQALEKAVFSRKKIWYEALTITDENEEIDLSKAKHILNYSPQ